ncbi:MAG: HEAT repeat domain-containing protein, partial [Tepidisphaeraceae bacterium]
MSHSRSSLSFASLCLLAMLAASDPGYAYIDMPAEKLTLPRLLLEFRTSGIYRIERLDIERGAVRFAFVEAIQGAPREAEKHVIRLDGKVPAAFADIREGDRAVLFGPDPYARSLVFLAGHWYVSNWERDNGWWRIGYTESHFDFACAFCGPLPQLVENCRTLLDGDEAVVPCHRKPKKPEIALVRVTLRDPHKRIEVADPATRPATQPALPDGRSVAELLNALNDPTSRARMLAAHALGRRNEQSSQSIALLIAATGDSDPFVRRAAAMALGAIGSPASPAIPRLLDMMRDGYENTDDIAAWEARCAILRLDPAGEIWLPVLRMRLRDKSAEIRRKAAGDFGILGPSARIATPLLLNALADANEEVRFCAIRSLDKIEADPAIVAAPLVAMMADKARYVPDAAFDTLRNLGQPAAVEIGKALAPSNDVKLRRRAARLLREMGDNAAPARAALESAKDDPDE